MADIDSGTQIDNKLNTYFPGKVVRKDLTKLMKVGHNVPLYVLEYLLGSNCATDDEDLIQEGVKKVKKILSDNYVRPDEAELIKSKIREMGYFTIIDKVTVRLNEIRDVYEAGFRRSTGAFNLRSSAFICGSNFTVSLAANYNSPRNHSIIFKEHLNYPVIIDVFMPGNSTGFGILCACINFQFRVCIHSIMQ